MKTVCIIPARGGSVRIPRKNIKPFHGKPIIEYSIETAQRSMLFDDIIVSTDDADISFLAADTTSPVGTFAFFLYCELKPKFARPLRPGFATYEPAPTLSQPPPVTNPPFGS